MSTIRCTIAAVVLLTAVTYAHTITAAATDNQHAAQSSSFGLSGPTPGPNGPTSSSSASLTALKDADPKKNAKRDAAADVDEKSSSSSSSSQPQVDASGIPSQAPAHYQSVYASYPALGQYYAGATGATATPQIYYVKAPTQNLHNTLGSLQYGGPIKLAYAAQSPQAAFTVTGPGNKQYVIQSPYQPYSNYPTFLAYAPAGNQHLQQPQQHHPQQQQQQQQQTYIYSQPPPHAQQLHSPALQYSQLALAYATPTSPAATSAANHPQQQQQQQHQHQQQLVHQQPPHQHQHQAPQTQIISNYIPHGYQLATVAPAASPLHFQQQQPPLQQVPSSLASPSPPPHHPDVYQHQSQSQQQPQHHHHSSSGAAGLAHTYSFVTVPTSLTKPTALPPPGGSINYYAGPPSNHLYQSSLPSVPAASAPPSPQQHQHFQQQQSSLYQHQQPQSSPSYIYSSYHHPQQSGPFAQASGPHSQKLIGFSPSPQYHQHSAAAQQYNKPLSAPVAPAPPAPTAHSHPVESATSYATFSQHLSVPHPGAVAASYSSSAPTKQQQVLAQPQHYAVAPPTHYASAVHQLSAPQYAGTASSVHPSSVRHVPMAAAAAAYNGPPLLTAAASATSPHVYASYGSGGGGGGGGPSAMHGAIHYGTHLYHPSAATALSKYGYGPVAPPSRIVYA